MWIHGDILKMLQLYQEKLGHKSLWFPMWICHWHNYIHASLLISVLHGFEQKVYSIRSWVQYVGSSIFQKWHGINRAFRAQHRWLSAAVQTSGWHLVLVRVFQLSTEESIQIGHNCSLPLWARFCFCQFMNIPTSVPRAIGKSLETPTLYFKDGGHNKHWFVL